MLHRNLRARREELRRRCEEDVVTVILPKEIFFKIAEKQIESVKDKIDTNDFKKLLELEAVIEDLNTKDSFPIIERSDSSLTL